MLEPELTLSEPEKMKEPILKEAAKTMQPLQQPVNRQIV